MSQKDPPPVPVEAVDVARSSHKLPPLAPRQSRPRRQWATSAPTPEAPGTSSPASSFNLSNASQDTTPKSESSLPHPQREGRSRREARKTVKEVRERQRSSSRVVSDRFSGKIKELPSWAKSTPRKQFAVTLRSYEAPSGKTPPRKLTIPQPLRFHRKLDLDTPATQDSSA